MWATTDLWVRRYHPAPAAPLGLLCLPHAGGSASYFFGASRTLSPRIEVLAVQYPGRQDRRAENCIDNVADLADRIVDSIAEWTGRPLALFGHSMGATLAFEVAVRLEQMAIMPAALFVSGRRAPSRHRHETVHLRDDGGIIAELQSLGGMDSRIIEDPDLAKMILHSVRSDYKAIETYRYRPGPQLACPIHALVGTADPQATLDEAGSWADHTRASFTLHTFPGGHFYLDTQAPAVLDTITSALFPS